MYLIENSLTESSTVSILSNNPYALYHNLKFSHAVAFAYASAGSYLEDRLQEFCNKVCNKVCSKVCNMVCNKLIQHHMQWKWIYRIWAGAEDEQMHDMSRRWRLKFKSGYLKIDSAPYVSFFWKCISAYYLNESV